jgi:hypothetical protein
MLNNHLKCIKAITLYSGYHYCEFHCFEKLGVLMSEAIVSNLVPLDRKLDYSACIQFLFMHLACLASIWTGVSLRGAITCLALYVVRMFAITAGFHRL